jgi:serine/threonine protein kinase
LLHGDLYAHNILHNANGNALLGDFGAASFFTMEDQAQADALQRLEVRAFACLLEELLERSGTPHDDADPTWASLNHLKTACLQETPDERPLFTEIEQQLRTLC